jgi:pyruvate formate-lyase/glycerol dehydratase family glycyl radical enzyme
MGKMDSEHLSENCGQTDLDRSHRLWNRLLEARRTAPVSQCRAKLLTASWKETEGLPTPIRRARAFEKIMREIPIFLDEDQLFAGNFGSWPMAIEWRPETTVEWVNERFEAGIGRLIIKDDDIPVMKDIAAYWKDKDVFSRYHRYIGKEEEQRLKNRDFLGAYLGHSYYPALWALGWFIPDYPKVIRKGLSGILAEVEQEIKGTPLLDEFSQNKHFFLEALAIIIRAGIQYAKRHSVLALEMSKSATGKRKAELEKISEICGWVPENPARTFHEALQTLWFCHLFIFWDSQYEGVSPGRVDQYLYPYYRKDIEAGRLTREEAIELLELLRCSFSTYRVFLEAAHATRTSGEANWFNCMLGGLNAEGQDATNELSYLWLEAAKRLGTPHPTLSVRVHDKMNEDFALKAAELCSLGRGYPAFFGDKSNIGFLIKQGVPREEAWDYAIAGCTLTFIPGRMAPANPFGINIPKFLELALNDGVDPRTGRQLGPRTGSFESFQSYVNLWEAYRLQIRNYIRQGADDYRKASLFQATILPHLFPSLLADDCIKRGQPHNGQGCHYQQGMWYLLPQGPIDVADSLAAIKKCVFEDKTITKKQLMEALAKDFEGEQNQAMRRILLSAPKYGNDNDYVDLIARDVYSMLDIELADIDGCYGAKYVQAPHSLTGHGAFGRAVGALPSGRRAWVALADGNASPSQGMDKEGVTAVLKSASKLDQLPMQGCLLNQKIHPSALKNMDDFKKFVSLIKTYLIKLEGKHIQFNIVSKETLLDARAHPEQYRTLVVRVAGYSAMWVDLDSVIQDEIIARTEQIL